MQSDEVLYFEIWDDKGRSVVSEGDIGQYALVFRERYNENFVEGDLRNVYRTSSQGAVHFITKAHSPFFQGSASRERACTILLALAPRFKKIRKSERQSYEAIIRRFAHNLIKFQTRFKGNFGRLISDSARSRPYTDLKDEVRRRMESDIDAAAHDVCQMSHRAVDLDAQIATLRVISGYAERNAASTKIKVNLQKGMFRLTNPFVEELRSKGIEIHNNIPNNSSDSDKVLVDPDLFNAAIWQLLDNASKYVLEGTPIEITARIDQRPQILELAMTSVCIELNEVDSIFLEGQKGRHAGNKGETGIGLHVVKKALGLMGAMISAHPGAEVETKDGFKYCRNVFRIEFAP